MIKSARKILHLILTEDFFSHWKNSFFVLAFIQAASFLACALIINYYAVHFATERAGAILNDTFFYILPKVDTSVTSFIDYYVALSLQYGFFLLILFLPRFSVFFLKALALLILVRSFFINLTQLGIPEGTIQTTSFFTQGGDLFFSGHTAVPVLAVFIFWRIALLRNIFIFLSIFMGTAVLLGRYHYSIDVFAAPFITYGVFVICQKLFKKDYDRIAS